MTATQTASPPIHTRRPLVAEFVSTAAATLARLRSALSDLVDGAQLGPDPQVGVSRWTGGRI